MVTRVSRPLLNPITCRKRRRVRSNHGKVRRGESLAGIDRSVESDLQRDTVIGAHVADVMEGLTSATGFLRREVAAAITRKRAPELVFIIVAGGNREGVTP